MKKIELTEEEKSDLYYSIVCRLAYIETGTIARAKDLEKIPSEKHKIKVLTTEQMRLIIRLEDLLTKLL